MTMQILHILKNGPTELSDQIIDVLSREHQLEYQIEVVDLKKKETPYEDLVDKIFSCDRLFSW